MRTFFTPESDSWLTSRPFIDEEGISEVETCVCSILPPANDSGAKEGKIRFYRGACAIRTRR